MVSDIVIVALISLVGSVITALIGLIGKGEDQKVRVKKKITKKRLIAMIGIIVVTFLIATFFVLQPSDVPSVSISSPSNGAQVNLNQQVTGISTHIPAGDKIWIVIHEGQLYYPMANPAAVDANGDWTYTANIGAVNDYGKSFQIIAVLADQNAQNLFNYGSQISDFPPNGATIYQTVTVIRNSAQSPQPTPSPSPTPSSTTPSPTAVKTSVAITYPTNNSDVNASEWVRGTSQNIPNGQQLWIVVHEGNLYFPMVDRVEINIDGTWTYNTTIGQTGDGGKSFNILAVLADSSAQSTVQAWYLHPYDFQSLPVGMNTYSDETVTRR